MMKRDTNMISQVPRLLVGLLFVVTTMAHADEIEWGQDSGVNFFNTGGNWVGGEVPGEDDTAVFNQDGTFNVVFDSGEGSVTNYALDFRDGHAGFFSSDTGSVTYTLTNPNNPWVGSSTDVGVLVGARSGETAHLTLDNVIVHAEQFRIGYASGSVGTLTVRDGGGLIHDGHLFLGISGTGTLNIEADGTVTSNFHTNFGHGASVSVSGENALWEQIGGQMRLGADMSLEITNGGEVRNAGSRTYVGGGANLLISGEGSVLKAESSSSLSLALGEYSGSSTVTVENGGEVRTHGTQTGWQGIVNILVTDADTQWTVTGNTNFILGQLAHTAEMTLRDGAQVVFENNNRLFEIGSNGTLTGDGGTIITPGTSGRVENAGLIAPGESAGVLTIQGNYTQLAGGVLEMELGGLSAGTEYDQLIVSGNLDLNGTLQILSLNGYAPQAGDTFQILDFGGTVTGTFASIDAFALDDPDLFWNFDDLYTTGTIGVMIPEPASMLLLGAGSLLLLSRRR